MKKKRSFVLEKSYIKNECNIIATFFVDLEHKLTCFSLKVFSQKFCSNLSASNQSPKALIPSCIGSGVRVDQKRYQSGCNRYYSGSLGNR